MTRLRYKMLLVLLGAVGLLSLFAWADTPKTTLPSPPRSGRFTLAVKSGGYNRVAHVHIPKAYKEGSKPPLVLLLHGGGGDGTSILVKDGWATKADKEGGGSGRIATSFSGGAATSGTAG